MTNIKSKERVDALGEVFTPDYIVQRMLDELPPECWHPSKTFMESSCGNGNFIVAIIRRKIETGSTPLQALSTTFGIDIMKDNIMECRERTLQEAIDGGLSESDLEKAKEIIRTNIVQGDGLSNTSSLPFE